ncbi:MAG: MarR family transcriptional regulator [Sneathiella sp.]
MERSEQQDKPLTDAYQLEEQIGYLLRKAHQRASAIFQSQFSDVQITPTQFATLVKLCDEGELSQNHLGRLTAMDPATIQGVTRRLIDRGLVKARADDIDRRRMLLGLTEKGKILIDSLVGRAKLVTAKTMLPLTEDEQRDVVELLKKLA